MPEKVEALAILFVLLPGFLCAYITQSLAVRRQQSDTEKVIEALIFSLILYLITLPLFGFTLPLHWQAGTSGALQIVADYHHLLTLFVLSVAFGTIYAANINHDWLMGLMRWAHVTEALLEPPSGTMPFRRSAVGFRLDSKTARKCAAGCVTTPTNRVIAPSFSNEPRGSMEKKEKRLKDQASCLQQQPRSKPLHF